MLLRWLKRTSLQPTWQSLSSALKDDMVREEALAEEIVKMGIFKVGQLGA